MDEIFNVLCNNFLNIIISIGKANLIVIGIVVLSFIVEKLSGLRLFIDHYTWIKSPYNAKSLSIRDTDYYLIINLAVFVYDIYQGKIEFHALTLATWLFIVGNLAIQFYFIHRKYQKVDPNKADDDYT